MRHILSVCKIEQFTWIKAYVLTVPVLKAAAPSVFLVWLCACLRWGRESVSNNKQSFVENKWTRRINQCWPLLWEYHLWCSVVRYCKFWNQDTKLDKNSMWQSSSWEANRSSAVQEITHFYGNRRFITVFTEPTTCPYPEPDQCGPFPMFQFLEIHFIILLPSTPGYYKWSLSLAFLHKSTVRSCLRPMGDTCPFISLVLT